jgi:hypothetical protein
MVLSDDQSSCHKIPSSDCEAGRLYVNAGVVLEVEGEAGGSYPTGSAKSWGRAHSTNFGAHCGLPHLFSSTSQNDSAATMGLAAPKKYDRISKMLLCELSSLTPLQPE